MLIDLYVFYVIKGYKENVLFLKIQASYQLLGSLMYIASTHFSLLADQYAQ